MKPSTSRKPGRQHDPQLAEARRQQILDAAADCFRRHGYHGASMAQIAEATREQSSAVAGIAGSAEKISIKTQSSASQVQETVTSLQQLQDRANDLLDVANRFKL